jgi:uncharacterized BrkB/YihY/UPF0761 family membrane protein
LYYGAAVCTGIAEILHLRLVQNAISFNFINYAIFFLVSGIAQLFWVLPMIKRWGWKWYAIGIVGTVILVGLTGYVIISILYNPISGRGGISEMAIAIEVFQVAYVVITVIIVSKERSLCKMKEKS